MDRSPLNCDNTIRKYCRYQNSLMMGMDKYKYCLSMYFMKNKLRKIYTKKIKQKR